MSPFHTRCPNEPVRETFGFVIEPGGGLPPGEYAIVEWYCDDPGCDCRRAFLQVVSRQDPNRIQASINFGWESRAFYQRQFPYDPDAPREITEGSLDPLNPQSQFAPAVLKILQQTVLDREFVGHLKRHYEKFKATLPRKH